MFNFLFEIEINSGKHVVNADCRLSITDSRSISMKFTILSFVVDCISDGVQIVVNFGVDGAIDCTGK